MARHVARQSKRAAPTIYLVELKYTLDDRVHGATLAQAEAQHDGLRQALRGVGWSVVVLPVIIGSWGTMRARTREYLHLLGIEPEAATALMHDLYLDSIHFTGNIASAHAQPTAFRSRREIREAKSAVTVRAARRAAEAALKRQRHAPRECVDGDWVVPVRNAGSQNRLSSLDRTTRVVTRAHKRRRLGDVPTSATAAALEDGQPGMQHPSPVPVVPRGAPARKRRRATSHVGGPLKRLRMIVSRTSITLVRTDADGTELRRGWNAPLTPAKRPRDVDTVQMEQQAPKRRTIAS